MVLADKPVNASVVSIGVHTPIGVGEHADPLKAWINAFEGVKLLPPPTETSMFKAVHPAGVATEYQTS